VRAVRWHGRGDLRLEQIDDPPAPGPGQVAIDVEWCGICGTDVEEFTHGPLVIPIAPHPLTGVSAPVVVGHEVAGRVRSVGGGVALEPDALVALDGYLYCGACYACLHHQVNLCDRWAHIGMSFPGGLAERLVVPAAMAIPATGDLPADQLALAEPLAVAVHAARRARLELGEHVAIVGAGTIGLALLQVAITVGCTCVVVVDPIERRRQAAAALGAASTAAALQDVAEGLAGAFDVVADCTGSAGVLDAALPLARAGGRVVLVGLPPGPVAFDYQRVLLRELTLIGTVGHVYDVDTRAAVELLSSRRVHAAPMISHRLPLERAIDDGVRYLAGTGRTEALKILICPRPDP